MISRIKSTPLNELPDQSLHTEMIHLQQDIDEHLSEKSIFDQIEEFKNTMKSTQGVTVSTTHRNAIIQAEIETKDEYLRLNQGSGESLLDTTSKDRNTNSGLIERDINNKSPEKIRGQSQRKDNNNISNKTNNGISDFKMKSKFEGMEGFVAPKTKKEKRIPDEKSNLEHVRNSISVNLMKESTSTDNDDDYLKYSDDDNDDDENNKTETKRSDKKDKNNSNNKTEENSTNVKNKSETDISEEDEVIRKQQQLERLEKIANMKGKEYLIGWG